MNHDLELGQGHTHQNLTQAVVQSNVHTKYDNRRSITFSCKVLLGKQKVGQ